MNEIITVNSLNIEVEGPALSVRYNRMSYINGLWVLGENFHFDISGYLVIFEFDIKGVHCIS